MGSELGQRLQGVSHLALNSSDMAKTVEFFDRLGIPLVKTMDMPQHGFQHFFFDIGNGDCLAYFWYNDQVGAPATEGEEMLDGAMNHVAFRIAPEDVQECWDLLTSQGIPFGFVAHSVERGPNGAVDTTPQDRFNDLTAIGPDTYAASFYFQDPDGAQLEFCAWFPAWDRFNLEYEPKSTDLPDRTVSRVPSMVAAVLPQHAKSNA